METPEQPSKPPNAPSRSNRPKHASTPSSVTHTMQSVRAGRLCSPTTGRSILNRVTSRTTRRAGSRSSAWIGCGRPNRTSPAPTGSSRPQKARTRLAASPFQSSGATTPAASSLPPPQAIPTRATRPACRSSASTSTIARAHSSLQRGASTTTGADPRSAQPHIDRRSRHRRRGARSADRWPHRTATIAAEGDSRPRTKHQYAHWTHRPGRRLTRGHRGRSGLGATGRRLNRSAPFTKTK